MAKQRDDDDEASDRVFETKADALAGVSRPLKRCREGAQVDVSIINRDKGSGASYVIKYVAKAIGAEGAFDGEDAPAQSQREQRTLQAIDAYRSLWCMRGAQFFGIRNCLGLWDKLRAMKEPPVEPELLQGSQATPSSAAESAAPKRSRARTLPPPVELDADEQTLLGQVIDYYHQTLQQAPEALAYLQARGIAALEVCGPVMPFLTTTAIDIDEELMNRCLVLSVDEGREQTAAIHRQQRLGRTLDGLIAKQHKREVLALHRNAQRLLRPHAHPARPRQVPGADGRARAAAPAPAAGAHGQRRRSGHRVRRGDAGRHRAGQRAGARGARPVPG